MPRNTQPTKKYVIFVQTFEGEEMDIALSQLMHLGNLREYKIHFAVSNRVEQPLDVFVRDPDEWKGWNSWRGARDDFSRRYIFSLIRYYHQRDRWLFGGIFEVLGRHIDRYDIQLLPLYQEYIGKVDPSVKTTGASN